MTNRTFITFATESTGTIKVDTYHELVMEAGGPIKGFEEVLSHDGPEGLDNNLYLMYCGSADPKSVLEELKNTLHNDPDSIYQDNENEEDGMFWMAGRMAFAKFAEDHGFMDTVEPGFLVGEASEEELESKLTFLYKMTVVYDEDGTITNVTIH